MNWKLFNFAMIIGGGALFSPLVLAGLGTEDRPPPLTFTLVIFAFSFIGSLALVWRDMKVNGARWVYPSLSNCPFGPGSQVQGIYISSVSLIWLGVMCSILGGKGERIEWMGFLPIIFGAGLLASVYVAKWLYPENFDGKRRG